MISVLEDRQNKMLYSFIIVLLVPIQLVFLYVQTEFLKTANCTLDDAQDKCTSMVAFQLLLTVNSTALLCCGDNLSRAARKHTCHIFSCLLFILLPIKKDRHHSLQNGNSVMFC